VKSLKICEYIWLDGDQPVCKIRSKTKVIHLSEDPELEDFSVWSFDGSSTKQAIGGDSDCLLKPVCFVRDSLADGGDYLVLCEVQDPDGSVHKSNTRSVLREALDKGGNKFEPWIGFEQEYTIFKRNKPLGWPEHGSPAPQGPYYCGVGSEQIFGREIAVEHAHACIEADLIYYGMNAEVMPGQWEFQIGYRGILEKNIDALSICDHMWIARWLLHRISEYNDVHISFDNKPMKGDWNGAGMHTNFSTNLMRDSSGGQKAIEQAIELLSKNHNEHIKVYGDKLEERLTGIHETSSINEFSAGSTDRGRSIRVPRMVELTGCGYLEDRRPGANADPYLVVAQLIKTICQIK